MYSKDIIAIMKIKGIYKRQPDPGHFRAVRRDLNTSMQTSRAKDMAGLVGYDKLLRDEGNPQNIHG